MKAERSYTHQPRSNDPKLWEKQMKASRKSTMKCIKLVLLLQLHLKWPIDISNQCDMRIQFGSKSAQATTASASQNYLCTEPLKCDNNK